MVFGLLGMMMGFMLSQLFARIWDVPLIGNHQPRNLSVPAMEVGLE